MNEYFSWLKKQIQETPVDFVLWTGDNTRHDNDPNYPVIMFNNYELKIFNKNVNINKFNLHIYTMYTNCNNVNGNKKVSLSEVISTNT